MVSVGVLVGGNGDLEVEAPGVEMKVLAIIILIAVVGYVVYAVLDGGRGKYGGQF